MQRTTKTILVMALIIITLLSFAICVYTIANSQETLDKAQMYDYYKPSIDRITSCKTQPMVICS